MALSIAKALRPCKWSSSVQYVFKKAAILSFCTLDELNAQQTESCIRICELEMLMNGYSCRRCQHWFCTPINLRQCCLLTGLQRDSSPIWHTWIFTTTSFMAPFQTLGIVGRFCHILRCELFVHLYASAVNCPGIMLSCLKQYFSSKLNVLWLKYLNSLLPKFEKLSP